MYNLEDIKKVLPHRDSFLFLDEVIETNYNDNIVVAKKTFNKDLYIYNGHFPNNPITPGVILLEGMAQAGAFLVLATDEYKGKMAFFAGADEVKWKKPVLPGDTVIFKVKVEKIRHNVGVAQAYSYVNDEVVCEAKIKVAIR